VINHSNVEQNIFVEVRSENDKVEKGCPSLLGNTMLCTTSWSWVAGSCFLDSIQF